MNSAGRSKRMVTGLVAGLLLCITAAAAAVPPAVMDARDSVVRIIVLDEDGEMEGHGTGFTVDKNSRYVVTNYHVAGEAEGLVVRVDDETEIAAVLVTGVEDKDLAIIRMEEPLRAPGIPLRRPAFEAGVASYALGYPGVTDQINQSFRTGKDEMTVTDGIVGGVRNTPLVGSGSNTCKVVQSTTTINPGNSGGPLLDEKGRLIGVNTFGLTEAQSTYGAVHIDELRRVLEREEIPYRESKAVVLWLGLAAGGVVAVLAVGVLLLLRRKRRAKVLENLAKRTEQEQLVLPLLGAEEAGLSAAPAPKKRWMTKPRWIALATAVVLVAAGSGMLLYARQMDAQLAEHLRAGEFALALEDVEKMPWVTISAQERQYIEGFLMIESGEQEQALPMFEELGEYQDSKEVVWRLRRYLSADKITDPIKRFNLFSGMEGFLDSEEKAQEAVEGVLEVAFEHYYNREFFEAIPLFGSLEEYDEEASMYQAISLAGQTLARAGAGSDIGIVEIDEAVNLLREAEKLGFDVEPACMDPSGVSSFLNGSWKTAAGEKFTADLRNGEFDFSTVTFPGGDYYFSTRGIVEEDGTPIIRWSYESVDQISMKVYGRSYLFTREDVPEKDADSQTAE